MKEERLWNRNFIIMIFSNLATYLAFQMLGTTLPLFITSDLHGNNSQVGMVVGAFTIAALFIRPIAGNALTKHKKTTLLTIGLAVILASMGSYFFVSTIATLLLVRLLHGAGFGFSSTTIGTIAADIIPPSRRGEGMGYYGLASTMALAIGPVIGLYIAETYSFSVLFICCFFLTLLAIILVKLVDLPTVPRVKKSEEQSFFGAMYEKKALVPSLLLFCLGITIGGVSSFIALFGKEQGIENVTLFFLVEAIFVMAIRPFTGKIYDRSGHFYVIIPCGICMFLGTILISFSTSLPLLLLAAAVYGAGFGSMVPSLQAWMIDLVEPHRRGVGSSTFYSAMDLGVGAGATVCGMIASATSYAVMFRYASAFVLVMFIVYFIYLRYTKVQNKVNEQIVG